MLTFLQHLLIHPLKQSLQLENYCVYYILICGKQTVTLLKTRCTALSTISELAGQKWRIPVSLATQTGKQTYFICQIPKLTPFWWESSIWNTSHQHHSWHSRVKLITSDTCASSQSGRLICIEEHSAEVIDAHTKYGHPMTPAPSQSPSPSPKAWRLSHAWRNKHR